MAYATVQDIIELKRPLTTAETERAEKLIPIIEAELKYKAHQVHKDLDEMLLLDDSFEYVLKSVIVDIAMRELMTSTTQEPMTQYSESANGYSASGSFLVPGGGLFIKKSELKRLGLGNQQIGLLFL